MAAGQGTCLSPLTKPLTEHPGSVGTVKLRLNFLRPGSDHELLPDVSFGDGHLDRRVQNPRAPTVQPKPGHDQLHRETVSHHPVLIFLLIESLQC